MKDFFKAMSSTVVGIMLVGVLAIVASLGDLITSFKPAVDFDDMLEDGVPSKGAHIKGTPVDVWGVFATQDTVTKSKYGSTISTQKGTATFYVVPVNIDDEFYGIIGVKVGKAYTTDWNKLYREITEFYNKYYDGEDPGEYPEADFIYEGKVTAMKDSQMIRYFKKWMEDDYTADEMERIPLYLIEPLRPEGAYMMVGGGLLAIVICILITISRIKKVREAEEQAKREAARIAELQRENEMLYGNAGMQGSDMVDTFNTGNNAPQNAENWDNWDDTTKQ